MVGKRAIIIALRRVDDPVVRERLLMIQEAYSLPLRDVAKKFGCTHGKVDFWKKRFEAGGIRALATCVRSGRPPKMSREKARVIRRKVRKHNMAQGWRTKHVKELIYEDAGVKYSTRQTIRIIQSWGLSKIKPRQRYAYSKQEDRDTFLKKTRTTWRINQKDSLLSSKTKASSRTT